MKEGKTVPGAGDGRRAGVIFDLDGVIIDSEAIHYQAYNTLLAEFGIEVSRSEYAREWIARGQGPEYAVEHYRLPITPAELRRRKEPIYHELLRRGVNLMPGARPALERLRPHLRIGLATNSSRADTEFVLQHCGIGEYYDAVVTREMYERAKPAPDAYLTAARLLGLATRRCVAVEDSFRGVSAATAAACPCLAVPNELTRENDFSAAARVLGSLDELTPALVERLIGDDR